MYVWHCRSLSCAHATSLVTDQNCPALALSGSPLSPPTHRVGHNEVIGVCRTGLDAEGLGRDHWNEMLAYHRKPITHWHHLQEVSSWGHLVTPACILISQGPNITPACTCLNTIAHT